jgi:hypothetical protein
VRIRTGAALTTLALTLLTSLALSPSFAAPAPAPAAISRSAHIAYGGCPIGDVLLTVTVPGHSFAPGVPVPYGVSLHDLSVKACGSGPRTSPGPTALGALLGPCGELPLTIDNARGIDVYPGSQAISCPVLLGPALVGHQTLTATGTWGQTQGGGRPARVVALVPRGTYHLVIGNKVRVPIDLPSPRA